jgi:hypothetical protein
VQDLQSEAQITFPDTPKVEFSDGVSYYISRNNNCLYFASVTDLNKINKDSLNESVPDGIYDQFISSTIKPLKGEVFYTKKIETAGSKGVSFNYRCAIKGDAYYCYQQVFHLNDALVSYSLMSRDSLKIDDKKIKSFFATFKLTPARAADLNRKSGIMAGILIIGSLTFWGALVIYLIKKSRKKKSYKWPD